MNKAFALVLLLAGFWQLGTWGAALIGWVIRRCRPRRTVWHIRLTFRGGYRYVFDLTDPLGAAHCALIKREGHA